MNPIDTLIEKLPLKRFVEESIREDGTFDEKYFIQEITQALKKCKIGVDVEKVAEEMFYSFKDNGFPIQKHIHKNIATALSQAEIIKVEEI